MRAQDNFSIALLSSLGKTVNHKSYRLCTEFCVVQRVEHQLGVRGAAAARADLPLREAPLQDRHPPPRHRIHRATQVGI